MCYTRRKITGGVGALRDSDDTNFLKLNGLSRNLNIYGYSPSPKSGLKLGYLWTNQIKDLVGFNKQAVWLGSW